MLIDWLSRRVPLVHRLASHAVLLHSALTCACVSCLPTPRTQARNYNSSTEEGLVVKKERMDMMRKLADQARQNHENCVLQLRRMERGEKVDSAEGEKAGG